MPFDPQLLPWLVAAGLALLWLVQSVRLWWLRRRPAARLRDNVRQGAAGERAARKLLSRRGFTVLATQATCGWEFEVDGRRSKVTLRADFLVERDDRRYVADAKTGEVARLTASTRRQLLEYLLAFDVDGVLLVDPERGRIREVTFRLP